MTKSLLTVICLLSLFSCKSLRNYLQEPDTDSLAETLNSACLTGYAATVSMSVICGYPVPDVIVQRSNQGFPCTAYLEIDLEDYGNSPAERLLVAGLWADENTAVLSLILTNYHHYSNTIELVGIETIPVIREENFIHLAVASQEISLNPDQDALLSIDLDDFEFESELIRLNMPRPGDVYVAVTQSAYFIDVNTAGSLANTVDDSYTISGGGQFIEVDDNSADIEQKAAVDVLVSPSCRLNPQSGMALIRTIGVEDEGFPELGTAILEFYENCQGKARVFLATGIYVSSNGQRIPFVLQ